MKPTKKQLRDLVKQLNNVIDRMEHGFICLENDIPVINAAREFILSEHLQK